MREGARDSKEPKPAPSEASLGVRLLTELFGTFALVVASAGATTISAFTGGSLTHVERAAAGVLMVVALIYATGDLSGAHVNPAITLAFALRRVFHWRLVLPYWAAQMAGALLGAAALRALFGLAGDLGTTHCSHGLGKGVAVEALFTFLLGVVVLNTSNRHKVVGPNAALGVGATVFLGHLVAEPVSGAALNPARALGPALVSGNLDGAWVYLAGPMAGAMAAVVITRILRGPPKDCEQTAAEGEEGASH